MYKRTRDAILKNPPPHETCMLKAQFGRAEYNSEVAYTINTRTDSSGAYAIMEVICINPRKDGKETPMQERIYSTEGVMPTIPSSNFRPNIMEEPEILRAERTEYGKQIRKAVETGEVKESRHNMTELHPRGDGISNTITTVQKDNLLVEPKIQQVGNLVPPKDGTFSNPQRGRVYSPDGISPALDVCGGGNREQKIIEEQPNLKVREATQKGYAECEPGGVFDGAYATSKTRRGRVKEGGKIAPTLTAQGEQLNRYEGVVERKYRIRKLTPTECFRLMNVPQKDIDILLNAGISNSQLYKMAGNSIVCNVLYHIFRKAFIETGSDDGQLSLF